MELKSQILEVVNRYQGLSYNEVNNSLDGELFISDDDSYEVSIVLNPYPKDFPLVFETGERIPLKVSRHIYSDTKSCCLTTQAKAQILLRTQISTLYLFVKEIVIPYFQNNSFFELNGRYKTDEYSHNQMGVIEGYRDILQLPNDYSILELISQRIKGNKLGMHSQCYCGSQLSLKKCKGGDHYKCYKDFRKIDKALLTKDGVVILKNLNKLRS